jgi:hypothetical protein
MTAKEKLLERAPRWSERDAEVALRAVAVEHEHTSEDKRVFERREDLERYAARASRGVLRHMTEEEEAAGFSWEKYR